MTVDVSTGTTITFGTSGFTAEITGISHDEISRAVRPVPHMGSSGAVPKIVGDLVDYGSFTVEFHLDPDEQPPITGAFETVTITFPVPAGKSTGATLVGQAAVTGWQFNTNEPDAEMTASCVVTWQGNAAPVWTDSAV